MEKTLGEKRVRTDFNASGSTLVDKFKNKTADLIDLCQAMKNDEVVKPENKSPESFGENAGEKLRLIALAQTAYEEAAMWAEKAATI